MGDWRGIALPGFRGVLSRWRRRLGGQAVVLMYHRVAEVPCDPWELCVTPRNFDEQLDVLKRRTRVLSATELGQALEAGRLPRRAVVLTFDDGYADNVLAAKPLLEHHGLPATLFLTTGMLDSGREFWWDEVERIFLHPNALPGTLELVIDGRRRTWDLGPEATYDAAAWERRRSWPASTPPGSIRERVFYEVWDALRPLSRAAQEQLLGQVADWARVPRAARPGYRALTAAEARQAAAGGAFELGAHTANHLVLSVQPREVQEQEVRDSKELIESRLGQRVRHFAYPYGDYCGETVEIVRRMGFAAAFTTVAAPVLPNTRRWEVPRCQVRNWSGDVFARVLRTMF